MSPTTFLSDTLAALKASYAAEQVREVEGQNLHRAGVRRDDGPMEAVSES